MSIRSSIDCCQPARKSAEVLRLLRDVRIGPPTEGSFVVSVHTPVPPRLSFAQPALFDPENADPAESTEPFERLVSLKLYDAVQAAHNAANEALVDADGLDVFTDVVPAGVSANLCQALVGLGGEAGHSFELSLRPAPSRRFARAASPPVGSAGTTTPRRPGRTRRCRQWPSAAIWYGGVTGCF